VERRNHNVIAVDMYHGWKKWCGGETKKKRREEDQKPEGLK
jgi:hypothetical protein